MFHAIVADGQTIRVLEIAPVGVVLEEVAQFNNSAARRHERDLLTARPGRVVNRAAGIRQAYEPKANARQQVTRRWLKSVGGRLQALLASRGSQAVILVAAPRMLAELRREFPAPVLALVHAQLPRDLIHQPIVKLKKRLQPAVRAARREALNFEPVHGSAFADRSSALPA